MSKLHVLENHDSKNEGKLQIFPDKKNLREFIPSRPAFKKY